jgi:hypothetical protein
MMTAIGLSACNKSPGSAGPLSGKITVDGSPQVAQSNRIAGDALLDDLRTRVAPTSASLEMNAPNRRRTLRERVPL